MIEQWGLLKSRAKYYLAFRSSKTIFGDRCIYLSLEMAEVAQSVH